MNEASDANNEERAKGASWSDDAVFRLANKKWLRYSSQIARRVLAAMEEKTLSDNAKFINQELLARQIDVSAQYISKLLQGNENLTLKTIAKLSDALSVELIAFPDYKYSATQMPLTDFLNTAVTSVVVAKTTLPAANMAFTTYEEAMNAVVNKEVKEGHVPTKDKKPFVYSNAA